MKLNIRSLILVGMGAASMGLTACNSGNAAAAATSAQPAGAAPAPQSNTAPTAQAQPQLTLAVKFVEFKDPSGKVPISQDQAQQVIAGINQEYAQCGMAVKMEQYQQVDPASVGVPYSVTSMDQLDPIRKPFDDAKYLVVINTGAWDHGSMGAANAWTAMPGSSPSGAILEAPVANDAGITAHELGHYLGLDHIDDQSDMMNPVIYPDSTKITPDQCQTMRDTARGARATALR